MSVVRNAPADGRVEARECCRCALSGDRWDRIGGKAYCPECEEALALGEGEPLRERTVADACSVCDRAGVVHFLTFPLHGPAPVAIDLCPEHLRGLLSRRLGPHAFHQLQRQLAQLGVSTTDIFLLHEAFYDALGRAQQPIYEAS